MEGCCLYRFRKTVNVSNFYENGGGYVHQSNGTVRDFHLHLSYSKLQNVATNTAHLYTLLARMFDFKIMIKSGKCGIKKMHTQSSIGLPFPTIRFCFYQNHIKLLLIDPLIH